MSWLEDMWKPVQAVFNPLGTVLGGNFDITKSSLFTGAGTPWGPSENPSMQDLMGAKPSTDPNAYQGFNSDALRKASQNLIQRNAMRGRNNLAAQFAKMGVEGADRNKAMAQAQADENSALAMMNAENDWRDYQSRIDAMNRALGLWNQQLGMSQNEANQRGQFWGNLANTGLQLGTLGLLK